MNHRRFLLTVVVTADLGHDGSWKDPRLQGHSLAFLDETKIATRCPINAIGRVGQ